jgi:hypothetical protein
MIPYYTIQIIAILIAIRLGVHDAVAVNGFERCGSDEKEQSQFHNSNWQLKALICLGLSVLGYANWLRMAIYFFTTGLEVWILFDPVVALFRKNKQAWYYLSKGNRVDRILMKIFGRSAGVFKCLICLVIVILLNIFYNKILR